METEEPLTKSEQKLLKKSTGQLIQLAQKETNRYVRLRDQDKPCISCMKNSIDDAGHYIAVGRCEKLRFDLDNIHGQCRICNYHGGGETVDYRINLIKRIGKERVERLEEKYRILKRDTSKWDKVELILWIRQIRKKIKEFYGR
ncbi:MAG: recombination protein NinG [Bacteroidales bacterium]